MSILKSPLNLLYQWPITIFSLVVCGAIFELFLSEYENPFEEATLITIGFLLAIPYGIVQDIENRKKKRSIDSIRKRVESQSSEVNKDLEDENEGLTSIDTASLNIDSNVVISVEKRRKLLVLLFLILLATLLYFFNKAGLLFPFSIFHAMLVDGEYVKPGEWSWGRLIPLVLTIVFPIILLVFIQRRYSNYYHSVFVKQLLQQLNIVSSYLEGGKLQLVKQILPKSLRFQIKTDHRIELNIDNKKVAVSNLRVQRTSGESTITLCDGVLVELMKSPLLFKGTICLIKKDNKESNIGLTDVDFDRFIKVKINNKVLEEVGLISNDFQNLFDLYGSDQVEIRKLLTPSLIDLLLVYAVSNDLCLLTIDEETVYCALNNTKWKTYFNPKFFLSTPRVENERVQAILNEVDLNRKAASIVTKLVTDLNLIEG